ncbi:MAG: serine/threonine protein kinase [Phycisphaerales bacterium]|nr:serine/threonine protein kinase [Phycisphaerales bacterium]
MDLHCPYCKFLMVVKGVRAGSFTPRCSQCQEKFALVIPEGENAVPQVRAIAKSAEGAATLPPVGQTQIKQPQAMPAQATLPPRPAAVTTPPPSAPRVPITETLPPRPPAAMASASIPAASVTPPAEAPRVGSRPPSPVVPSEAPRLAMDREDDTAPSALGSYQIQRKLGQGGMGAVYLARQMSLDRNVAVKVLNPKLAEDAGLVARFTREAYASAQLVHHNVVQVYDIGEDRGKHFYSMEFVDGDNLAAIVHRDGKLDPETAVAYTLQAARGLKFAHDRGLIHRDVKPDNLMLNGEGIVKVADLGLVKWHGVADIASAGKLGAAQSAGVTAFNHSMGTPAYMAPEQARDAAHVDHRADIYSLGCTLYDLLVGRPPFTGKTAVEVMTKHASEPITPPDVLSKRVPKEVSALLMKMVAKRPDERYADLGQCIVAMEDFLGTSSTGPFTPKEEHAAAVESSAKAFRDTTLSKVARYTVPAYFGLVSFIALMAAMLGDTLASRVIWAGTFIGLGVLTAVAYVIVAGITRRDVTLGKLRPLVFGMRWADWLKTLCVIACLGLILYVFDLGLAWAAVGVVAVIAACVYHFGLQQPRDKQRAVQVEAVHAMLRTMRLRGLDEETLRQFVCRYSGQHWEEFYEALFDYDSKIEARRRWGLGLRGKPRPKFGIWRDAIIAWANARVLHRKEARDRRLLAKTEEAKLQSEGVDLLAARKTAQREAEAMVKHSEVMRKRALAARDEAAVAHAALRAARSAATSAPGAGIGPGSPLTGPSAHPSAHTPHPHHHKTTIEVVHHDHPEREHESAFKRKGGWHAMLFGPSIRFPIVLVLLAAFALWFRQNNPEFPQKLGAEAKATVEQMSAAKAAWDGTGKTKATPRETNAPLATDLRLAMVPERVRHQVSGFNVGVAGLLLLISCFVRGWKLGMFALVGAAVMVGGDLVVPGLGAFSGKLISSAIGAVIIVFGFSVGRES